ncbi:MAG: hypothetical protein QW568_05405, partial [Candidatus Anstonellaceae archaeon]
MAKQIFVNLPVKSLARSIRFWGALGFKFDKRFTDRNAACLVLGKGFYAMLLAEKFFKSFNKRGICNTKKELESITALQMGSKSEVDRLTAKGYRPAELHGEGCTGCAVCALVCPEAAITVYRSTVTRGSEAS